MNFLNKTLSCCLVVCFIGSNLLAQTNTELSLQQAIEASLQNAYSIKVVKKNKEIAENNNHIGEAGGLPTVNASLSNQNNYSNIKNPASFLDGAQMLGVNGNLGIDASWTIFEGGKIRLNKERLALLVTQSGADEALLVDNITQQTTKAYYNTLVQQKRLSMQQEVLVLSRQKIEYIETRREYGQALEFDLLQIKDAYLNDSIQWLLQETSYKNALQNLALAMGLEPKEDLNWKLTDTLVYELANYEYDALLDNLLQNNRQLKLERVKIGLSELDLALQKANQSPKLMLTAGGSEQLTITQINGKQPIISNDWKGGATISANVGLSLTYTIYNGGKIKRGIENAGLRRQISLYNAQDLERKLAQQLKIAHNLFNNQKQILNLSQLLLANAQKNIQIASEKFKMGTLNYFDFRTVQMSYIRSINAVQDAFLNAKNTEIDLLLLTGQLLNGEN